MGIRRDGCMLHPLERQSGARPGAWMRIWLADIAANARDKLERRCRYLSRPPVDAERLALSAAGQVRYTLTAPSRDGTTHLMLLGLGLAGLGLSRRRKAI